MYIRFIINLFKYPGRDPIVTSTSYVILAFAFLRLGYSSIARGSRQLKYSSATSLA